MRVHRITDIDGKTFQCAPGHGGNDFTLCGMTLDDDPTIMMSQELITGKVTCKHCLELIKYCKSIKL